MEKPVKEPKSVAINGVIRRRVQIDCSEPKLVKQEFKQECDINHVIAQYKLTGELPRMRAPGRYADVSALPSYQEALELVSNAKAAFNTLSAKVRARFSNDPGAMLDFLNDPANEAEAVSLGLVKASEETSAPAVPGGTDKATVEELKKDGKPS